MGNDINDYLVTLNTVRARSLGMGGAFVSRKDDFSSLDFNPAGFTLATSADYSKVSFYINPLGPVLAYENRDQISHWTTPIAWFLRGIGLTIGKFTFGLLFGEESLNDRERLNRTGFFDASGYEWQNNTTMGISLALAEKVSLGVASDLYFRRHNNERDVELGYRYGLILQPRPNLNVGLSYFDFPNAYRQERMVLERLADETLNIGVSYTPIHLITLSLDVRNVSDEERGAGREPHGGIEIVPFRHFMCRGGFFRIREDKVNVYSFGIGVFDGNVLLPNENRSFQPFLNINTTLVWEVGPSFTNRWLLFSFIFRIW